VKEKKVDLYGYLNRQMNLTYGFIFKINRKIIFK